jgi:hypothetical protein
VLFKIPTATRKNFVQICRQFGHAPSKMLASPGVYWPTIRILSLQREREREKHVVVVIRRRKFGQANVNVGRYKVGRNWPWPVSVYCRSTHAERRRNSIKIVNEFSQ